MSLLAAASEAPPEQNPRQRPDPLTPEQVAKYQRLVSQGMKPEPATAEVRRAKA